MKTILNRTAILSLFINGVILSTSNNIIAQGLSTIQFTNFKAESRNGNVGLSWKTSSEKNLRQFEIEYSDDGKYYRNLGFIPATNHLNGDFYEFEHTGFDNDSVFYRVKIVDQGGRYQYTDPVVYRINKITAFVVNPSVISTHIMNLFLNDSFNSLEVISMNGSVLLKQNLSGETGRINIPLSPMLSAGMYVVQLYGNDKTITQKVIIQ